MTTPPLAGQGSSHLCDAPASQQTPASGPYQRAARSGRVGFLGGGDLPARNLGLDALGHKTMPEVPVKCTPAQRFMAEATRLRESWAKTDHDIVEMHEA
jgi:hypothetical protein